MYSCLSEYCDYGLEPRADHVIPKRENYNQSLIDRVFYINLDHRIDRKERLEKELATFGIPFERFPAIKESFGALGCSKSHVAIWKLAKERGYKRVLILEDDFTFEVSKEQFDKEIDQLCSVPFDVCMISYNIIRAEQSPYPFLKIIRNGQTLSGYLVNGQYLDTLISVGENSIPKLEKTYSKPMFAIDVVIKPLQLRDKWYHTTTRIGKQCASYSDIEQDHVDYKV